MHGLCKEVLRFSTLSFANVWIISFDRREITASRSSALLSTLVNTSVGFRSKRDALLPTSADIFILRKDGRNHKVYLNELLPYASNGYRGGFLLHGDCIHTCPIFALPFVDDVLHVLSMLVDPTFEVPQGYCERLLLFR